MTAGSPRRRPKDSRRSEVLHRFFAGLTEYTFAARLGVADPPLVDYLSSMLTHFVHCDAIYGLRSPTGERLTQVADMLAEAQARQGSARRRIHRHIGDFTLFWTGLYPEVTEQLRCGRKDSLIDYQDQGKRNYLMASRLPAGRESAPDDVLERLSDCFELCVYGLGELRKQWEDREEGGDLPILLG
ncbi:MAG: putative glycoside hydrolase [Pirellulales bacterium]|nr:putative glycoside hydrolase [Pirellulales bacterium]